MLLAGSEFRAIAARRKVMKKTMLFFAAMVALLATFAAGPAQAGGPDGTAESAQNQKSGPGPDGT